MKKVSYLLIVLFASFLFVASPKAISNTGIFSNLNISESNQTGQFNSNDSGSLSNKGYSLLDYNGYYYALPSTPNYFYGNYGGSLVQCGMSFLENQYYSVTYYFILNSGDYIYPDYSSALYKLGIGTNPGNTWLGFNYESINTGWQLSTFNDVNPIGDTLASFTLIFKAQSSGTCLNIAFSSYSRNTSASMVAFVGYTYENLGYRPLTAEEMANIINNSNQILVSQNQTIINQNNETNGLLDNQNQNLEDINDSLNNSTVDSANSSANEWASKSMSDNVVSNMVTMPITLLQAYLNGINNNNCSPYNLGNLMGTDIVLPCINLENYLGSTLWTIIDVLFSGFMIFALGKKFVKIFNDFTNLKDNQVDELYGGGN